MGLFDIFRMGKVLVGTARAIRQQRTLGKDLAALPMDEFVRECLHNLNQSAGHWEGRARPPNPKAAAIASARRLPAELAAFYAECDGFEAVHGEFPAPVLPLESLRLGSDHRPSLAERVVQFWNDNENDSDKPGLLAVLPPDDLMALAANAAECHLHPDRLNLALPLCEPSANEFVAVLLTDAGERLPRGTVLEFENGAATRYPGFKAWLGSRASLFGSIANGFGTMDPAAARH